MAAGVSLDQVHRVIATAVDTTFYRAVYRDLGEDDPVAHYASRGWREGRDPAPWFSTSEYLRLHEDVARADVNPLYHFLTGGRREGRDVPGSIHARAYRQARRGRDPVWAAESPRLPARSAGRKRVPRSVAPVVLDADSLLVATAFDRSYYAALNEDVASGGQDPLTHFMTFGWREGRDPNARFSVEDYLENYPDVAAAGVNPFLHYLRAGRSEGRTPRNDLGFRHGVIAGLKPLDRRIADVKACKDGDLGDLAGLLAALAVSRGGLHDLHLSFSHDDYAANTGGLQLCLQREDAQMEASGRDHLHFYPAKPWPVVRTGAEPGRLGVVWNGRSLGEYEAATVAEALREISSPAERRSFAIHSMLGHRADEVISILAAADLKAGYFWLHDFASLCAGFHLLRNEVADCGAPPPDSAACGICVYGPYRRRHLDEHARIFEQLDLTVVAPSQTALDTWLKGGSLPARAQIVHPHARLIPREAVPISPASQPFLLAFLGAPVAHKGWPIFQDLAITFADDPRYRFVHLAKATPRGFPIEHHAVAVSAAQPLAMRDELERLGVDAALVWSLCRETFSFTAYEATAAGAAVVTGPDSGNVAAFVAAGGHGLVLPDEPALMTAFETGEILALSRARRRPALYDLKFSGMTVDLLTEALRP